MRFIAVERVDAGSSVGDRGFVEGVWENSAW